VKKAAIISFVLSLGVVGMTTGTASAWYYYVSGSGVCQPDGSYKITWQVDNSSEPTQLEIHKSSDTDVVKVGETVPAHSVESFYQTVDGAKPDTYKLELTADWKEDRNNMVRSDAVTLDEACKQPVVPQTLSISTETKVPPAQVPVVPVGAVSTGEGMTESNSALISGIAAAVAGSILLVVRRVLRRP